MKTIGYNSYRSWIATIACALVGFLILIPLRLAGLFFVIIINQYDTDRKTATIPIVMFGVLRTLTGPFVGFLGELFGLRCMTIVGCVMSAVGVGSLYFAEDMTAVIICLGVIYGLGVACGNSLGQTIVIQHFNKNINLAIGTYRTGGALGAVVMTPIIRYLMNKYGVSGMFLVLSGILLNSLPVAILLKDPKNELRPLENSAKSDRSDNKLDKQRSSHLPDSNLISESEDQIKTVTEKGICTIKNLDLKNKKKEIHQIETKTSPNYINRNNAAFTNEAFDDKSENINSLLPDKLNTVNVVKNHNYSPVTKEVELLKYTMKQHSIDDMESKIVIHKTVVECTDPNFNSSCDVADHQISSKVKIKIMRQCLVLFADPTFHLIMFSNSILTFQCTMNWTVIADFAADKGINLEKSVYFVMFLPVAEIFGSMSLNWVVDYKFASRVNFCMLCYFVMAAATMLILFSPTFPSMMVGVLIFGFLFGVLSTTLTGVIVEYIEKQHQNMAFVSRYMLYGLLCLAKIPLIGYFRDVLGSYTGIYYIIATLSILCGIFIRLTPIVASYRAKRKLNEKM